MAKAPRQTSKQMRAKKRVDGEDPMDKKLEIENKELAVATGTVHKDKAYYKNLEKEIKLKTNHPKHHNVRMQAHHIVSEKAVKMTGKRYIDELLLLGYNINDLKNLVFIPSTLQGACHLGVQPHIGNHSAAIIRENTEQSYNDDTHPRTYHSMVKERLVALLDKIRKECPSTHPTSVKDAIEKLFELSRLILSLIQRKPGEAPLTNAYRSYVEGSNQGCGGELKIDKKKFSKEQINDCPVHRDHFNNQQGKNQKPEGIKFKKPEKYQLLQGN